MTLEEMVAILRQHLSDEQRVGWPEDGEIVAYLDRAAGHLSNRLIGSRDSTLLRKLRIKGRTPLPGDFVSFVGNVPVRIVGRECECYGSFAVDPDRMRWEKAGVADGHDAPIWGEPEEREKTWEDLTATDGTEVLYWSSLPFPSEFGFKAALPYTPEQATLILDIARIFALNKNEYDITQDRALLGELEQALAVAKKG